MHLYEIEDLILELTLLYKTLRGDENYKYMPIMHNGVIADPSTLQRTIEYIAEKESIHIDALYINKNFID